MTWNGGCCNKCGHLRKVNYWKQFHSKGCTVIPSLYRIPIAAGECTESNCKNKRQPHFHLCNCMYCTAP